MCENQRGNHREGKENTPSAVMKQHLAVKTCLFLPLAHVISQNMFDINRPEESRKYA